MPALQTRNRTPIISSDVDARTQALQFLLDRLDPSGDTFEQDGKFNPEYEKYQNDPLGFIREVLGVQIAPMIEPGVASVLENSVTVFKSANGVGKTHIMGLLAIWWLLCFPETQVWTYAAPPEDNLRLLLWGEIGSIVDAHPELFTGFRKVSLQSLIIQRAAQDFIAGVAIPNQGTPEQRKARAAGKHRARILFLVDEGDGVPDEIYDGIEMCMTGGIARLVISFNPKGQRGPVWIKERDRLAKVIPLPAFDHPNVITGRDVISGAVDRATTVRRINEWSVPLSPNEEFDHDCFDLPHYLVGTTAVSQAGEEYPPLPDTQRKITDPRLAYMVLARYPSQSEWQLISRVWVDQAVERWKKWRLERGLQPPLGIRPVMGQDVGEQGDDDSVSCVRYDFWVAPLESWNGEDPLVTAERACKVAQLNNVLYVNVDATGVGAAVSPALNRLFAQEKLPLWENEPDKRRIAHRLMMASKPPEDPYYNELGQFRYLRDWLWWKLREWFRTNPMAMIPPDEKLQEELVTPTYQAVGNTIRVMEKKDMHSILHRSPDKADALALTFYRPPFADLYTTAPTIVQVPQEVDRVSIRLSDTVPMDTQGRFVPPPRDTRNGFRR